MSPASKVTYHVLRELGARGERTFAAMREPHELVVLHRFARSEPEAPTSLMAGATTVSSEQLAMLLRDAQSLAKNWHPNVVRVKHVDLAQGTLSIATELVDGATLADLVALTAAAGSALSLDVIVRVLLDVLSGIHGMHVLRDDRGESLGVVHGALCPTNIVVGKDGIARILSPFRPRPARIVAGSESVGYAAPETLDGGALDCRSDVYAVGVMLWEALTGARLHDEQEPARVLARQREIDLPRPKVPGNAANAALVDIAMRALSFEPSLRFRTATEMTAELRKLPAKCVASGSVVAMRVNELDGERIRGRRAALDPSTSSARMRASAAPPPTRRAEQLEAAPPEEPTAPRLAAPSRRPSPPRLRSAVTGRPPPARPQVPSPAVPRPNPLALPTPAIALSVSAPPPPPSSSARALPDGVLSAPPEAPSAFPGALELAEAAPELGSVLPATTSGLSASVDLEPSDDGGGALGPSPRRRRAVLAVAGVLLVAIGILVIGAFVRTTEQGTTDAASTAVAAKGAAIGSTPPPESESAATSAPAKAPKPTAEVTAPEEPTPSLAAASSASTPPVARNPATPPPREIAAPPATPAPARPPPPRTVRQPQPSRRYEPLGI